MDRTLAHSEGERGSRRRRSISDTKRKNPTNPANATTPPQHGSPSTAAGKRRAGAKTKAKSGARKKRKANDGSTSQLAISLVSSSSNPDQTQSSPLDGWLNKAGKAGLDAEPQTLQVLEPVRESFSENITSPTPKPEHGAQTRQSTPLPEAPLPAEAPLGAIEQFETGPPLKTDEEPPTDEPNLCPEQRTLVDLIVNGQRNVFYTGSAGCGKLIVLKAVVKELRAKDLVVHVVAPTGRAALQVDGKTTWTYMSWTPDSHKVSIEKLRDGGFRKFPKKRMKQTDVLIIDEISMIENHHLERMNEVLKEVRCYGQDFKPAFGGIKVIVTGDFCQLPPVKPFQHCYICGLEMTLDSYGVKFNCPKSHGPFLEADKWAFKSKAWEEADFFHVNLEQVHRQADQEFVRMLQKCRLGIPFTQEETAVLMDHPCQVTNATKLMSTRQEVSNYNFERFNKLKSEISEFCASDGFKWSNTGRNPNLDAACNADGTLVACKDFRLDSRVTLRKGMLVVLLINLDLGAGLCNGSQGIICGFEDYDPMKLPCAGKGDEMKDSMTSMLRPILTGPHAKLREYEIARFAEKQKKRRWPKVRFLNNTTRVIYPSCVVNSIGDREPYSLLYRTQVPLVAGWALSIHKSQGMTLSRVIVDLSKAFEEGQVYVALSRAKSLSGLKIEGDAKGLSVGQGGNDEVQEFLEAKFGSKIFEGYR